jgi:hypothetical protein
MKGHLLLGLLLLFTLGCEQEPGSLAEYYSAESPYTVVKTYGNYSIKASLLTDTYYALRDSMTAPAGLIGFSLTISPQEKADLLFTKEAKAIGYKPLLMRLMFEMGEYTKLYIGDGDAIEINHYQMMRSFGTTHHRTFMIYFAKPVDFRNGNDFTLKIKEFGLKTGRLRFAWEDVETDNL